MKYAFAIWFPIVATAIIVASLAIVGMPPVQSGPGALTALGLIPNLIVLALCLVVGVLSLVCRPRPLIASPSVAAVAIVGYLAVAITLFASSTINGYDTTQIVVSDSGRQPVSGVTIRVTSPPTLLPHRSTDSQNRQRVGHRFKWTRLSPTKPPPHHLRQR
jgi:hypothetical protein